MSIESLESPSGKQCCTCGLIKPPSEFNIRKQSKDGRQARCRDCCRLWHAANKERHNAQIHARIRRARRELGVKLRDYLRDHPCVDCGEADIRVLEFDHLSDKLADVSRMVREGLRWERILAEIAKCEVRCANCHRIRSYERAGVARASWI